MTQTGGPLTIEWFGCTTFRVVIGSLTLWFDTFVDRVPAAPPVGIASDEIDRADFVFVSHAHFDHILGADTVARRTGASVVGSYESMRVLRANDVDAAQLLPVSGGETVDCGHDVQVRVFPAQHSCLWAASDADAAAPCCGDLGVFVQERRERTTALMGLLSSLGDEVGGYHAAIGHRVSPDDGGQLIYLLETPEGSILFSASSGHWSGILADLAPDVAVLAAAGRPNVDGEPFQGSLAEFVVGQAEVLGPRAVVLCHHDAWMPPIPAVDVAPIAAALADRLPAVELVTLQYGEPVAILSPTT
jgi:L-ascorbate metabolism protein UlaG (beta-lactamase superfamily)